MSNHYGHKRSTHRDRSRSRNHRSSSSHYQSIANRNRALATNNNFNDRRGGNSSGSNSRPPIAPQPQEKEQPTNEWTEHRSSSGKVYYYNVKTGVSQWEIPVELKQTRNTSPESEISESSSIRQQQDKSPVSPSSSASSHNSANSDSVPEDKPLLTPSLAQYFRQELITNFHSSQIDELERQSDRFAREAITLSERILEESANLKIQRSIVHYHEIGLEVQERKFAKMKELIKDFGLA